MIAILHNIRSLHNVGSIFRTADAAGIEKLYLCGITPAPVDRFGAVRPQIAKVALGAERQVTWDKRHGAGALLNELRHGGYKIVAVEQHKKAVPYYKHKATSDKGQGKIALLVGNEVRGLPPSLLKKCDTILEIPMRGAIVRQAHHPRHQRRKMVRPIRQTQGKQAHHKESLNVAVAFGIVAFYVVNSSHP